MTTTTTWGNVLRGVAFGDAWGDPNEFQGIRALVRQNNGLGPDLPERLRITDDTQMTLYLAQALHDSWGQSPDEVRAAIRREFLTYRDDPENYRAPGTTVMGSLARLGRIPWQDATSHGSDGSGTVMRTSPCAFLPEDRWVGVTAYAAAITHGTPNAVAAAILNVAMMRHIIQWGVRPGGLLIHARMLATYPDSYGLLNTGEWLEGYEIDLRAGFTELARLIESALEMLPEVQADPWELNSDPSTQPDLYDNFRQGGGWRAHQTLVIALLAIDMIPDDPWLALRRSVTTAGDSDTIGAVAGGLLGACFDQDEFYLGWAEYRERFERIYVEWIEEADSYFPVAEVAA